MTAAQDVAKQYGWQFDELDGHYPVIFLNVANEPQDDNAPMSGYHARPEDDMDYSDHFWAKITKSAQEITQMLQKTARSYGIPVKFETKTKGDFYMIKLHLPNQA